MIFLKVTRGYKEGAQIKLKILARVTKKGI